MQFIISREWGGASCFIPIKPCETRADFLLNSDISHRSIFQDLQRLQAVIAWGVRGPAWITELLYLGMFIYQKMVNVIVNCFNHHVN